MIDYRRKTVIKGQQELRCGYTTGTCAAAAAKAAAVTLLSGEICRDVSLQLPGGEHIILETEFLECSENCVKCGMIKDAGDDPDITNGLLICAAVEKTEGKTILIDGGMGVGRVTKPGLDQPVGAAAINSVPRKMIHEAVEDVRRQYAWEKGLKVTVFIPNGKEKAEKTLNPMLGIVGGLSVLGTTGIVEPMSEKALIDTIAVDIRMHRAQNEDILLMAPGNYGLDYLKAVYHIHPDQVIKISNFIGDSIDLAVCEAGIGDCPCRAHWQVDQSRRRNYEYPFSSGGCQNGDNDSLCGNGRSGEWYFASDYVFSNDGCRDGNSAAVRTFNRDNAVNS
ncbi:MAG: cobalt-precorrin-5B (C(1))-methyltransferase CbiD [Coprococcus sp.]